MTSQKAHNNAGTIRLLSTLGLLGLIAAAPNSSANAILAYEVESDSDGIQVNAWRPDYSQQAYIRVDQDGWVGAGTHDAAANGVGAHAGTDTTVGYGLGAWWCDAGIRADQPDLIFARGTKCLGYQCLDDYGYNDLLAYAVAHPVDYANYVATYGAACGG